MTKQTPYFSLSSLFHWLTNDENMKLHLLFTIASAILVSGRTRYPIPSEVAANFMDMMEAADENTSADALKIANHLVNMKSSFIPQTNSFGNRFGSGMQWGLGKRNMDFSNLPIFENKRSIRNKRNFAECANFPIETKLSCLKRLKSFYKLRYD